MHTAPATRLLLAIVSCLPLVRPASAAIGSGTVTWSGTPSDGSFTTLSNWSAGDYPNGTGATALFGASTITTLYMIERATGTNLQFTSAATSPYTITFNHQTATTPNFIGNIINDSAWSPTLIFLAGSDMRQNSGATLDDATLIFTSGSVFDLRGAGGTSTIFMNSGSGLSYNRAATGESARLILNGSLYASTSSDIFTYIFGSLEGSGSLSLESGNGLTVGGNHRSTTFSGTFTGGGSGSLITKQGSGTWTLNAANNTAASFAVTGGTLAIDADARLGAGGTLTLDGGTLQAQASFSGFRGLTVGSGGGTLDTQAFSVTQSGALGGAGLFTKTGSGSLALNAAGTGGGGVRLAAGTLALGHDSALGAGTLTLAGGTLTAVGGGRSLANAVTLGGATTLGGSSALTFNGAWTLAGSHTLTVANSAKTTISGAIGENGVSALVKSGAGTLELAGANTYTGGTLISAGTVRITNTEGSAFGTGAVTIASGATLTGAGGFSGALQNNGLYAPGNSPALAVLSSFNQGATGTLLIEIAGLARGTGYDAIDVVGANDQLASATVDGTLSVVFLDGWTPYGEASFHLIRASSISGAFAQIDLPALSAGYEWRTDRLLSEGYLDIVSAIPEPASAAVLAGACALGAVFTRRRRRA